MTWEEINAAITEKVAAAKATVKTEGMSDKDREKAVNEALAAELQNMPHEVRQFLYDGGHRQATAQNAQKLQAAEEARKALETAKADLETQVQSHQTRITEIEGKTPDVEAVKRKMQEDFAKIESGLKEQVAAAEGKVTELHEVRKADRVEGFVSRLQGRLGANVTEDGIEWLQVRLDRMRSDGRFLPKDAEGSPFSVAVLRPGSTDMEYHATSEDELLTVVSQEVLEGAPKWAVKANVKGGGGALNGGGKGVNKWDKIRETAQNRGVQSNQESLNKRKAALLPEN